MFCQNIILNKFNVDEEGSILQHVSFLRRFNMANAISPIFPDFKFNLLTKIPKNLNSIGYSEFSNFCFFRGPTTTKIGQKSEFWHYLA